MENSADLDQKPAGLDLHCFLKIYSGSAGQELFKEHYFIVVFIKLL